MKKHLLSAYLQRSGGYRRWIPVIFLAVQANALVQAGMPWLSGWCLDLIIADARVFVQYWLLWTLAGLLVLCLLYAGLEFVQKMFITLVSARVKRAFQRDLYTHLLELDEAFYLRQRAGDISSRLTKDLAEGIEPLFFNCCQCVFASTMLIIASGVLFSLSPILGWFFLGIVPLWALYARLFLRRARVLDRAMKEEFGQLNARATEDISNQALVRVFAKEADRARAFRAAAERYRYKALALSRYVHGGFAVVSGLLSFVLPLEMILLAMSLFEVRLSAGELLAAYGTWVVASLPMDILTQSLPQFVSCYTGLVRVYDFLNERPLVMDAADARDLQVSQGAIRIQQLDFHYPGCETQVLQDIHLEISGGSRCALVGASGSGKSSLAHLVMRFYDPTSGCITIDGQDLRHISQHSLRRSIGLVQQDSLLWAGSVRDNLQFVLPEATEEDLWSALEQADLATFIRNTSDGLETVLGERGVRLSGGQRQRLALARLFLRQPRIVILDEATSALDGLAERAVQAAMARLLAGRTALIIAHRLSTVLDCEQIVVLEAGRIIDRGVHADLLQRCPCYRSLCQRQGLAL